jgi:hypothetical protein
MNAAAVQFLIQLLGFVGFLWLGLYVVARGMHDHVSRLAGITALTTSCLFLTGGIAATLHSIRPSLQIAFLHLMWWASVLPAACWLNLSMHLSPRIPGAWWRRPAIYSAYAAAALITVLGTGTDLIRASSHDGSRSVSGPLYPLYAGFLFVCAGFAVVNLARLRAPVGVAIDDPSRRPATHDGEVFGASARLLILGASCFLVSLVYYSSLNEMREAMPKREGPIWLLLLAGMTTIGATVAIQSNLLLGRDSRRDFLYNLTGLCIQLAPFLVASAALVGFNDTRARFLVLIIAAVITLGHVLHATVQQWLDLIFFTPPVRGERAAARAYVDALAIPPVGPSPELATCKAFDDAVRRAITSLSNPTNLATSPLLNLQVVTTGVRQQRLEDNRLNRAAVLKDLLLALLDDLCPLDAAGGVTSDSRRFYNCLYYPYVQGITRRRAPAVLRQLRERREREGGAQSELEQVTRWLLQLDEATFYKWQRRASDTIAGVLREREAASGGVVPIDVPGAQGLEATIVLA